MLHATHRAYRENTRDQMQTPTVTNGKGTDGGTSALARRYGVKALNTSLVLLRWQPTRLEQPPAPLLQRQPTLRQRHQHQLHQQEAMLCMQLPT